MNVLSLFDGMSCGRIALERAGIPVTNYYASEIDPYAIKVSKVNWPDIIHIGDVTKVKAVDLPKIDLLIGGSPCQGFSMAGKQLNFFDPRSALFFEFARLKNETKAANFLFENVLMKDEYVKSISFILNENPIMINSALLSAQNRKRLYWTNIPSVTQPKDKGIYFEKVCESGTPYKEKSQTILSTIYKENSKSMLKRKKFGLLINDQQIRKVSPVECERLQTVPDNYTSRVSNTQRYKMLGNGWNVDTIAHILSHLSYSPKPYSFQSPKPAYKRNLNN